MIDQSENLRILKAMLPIVEAGEDKPNCSGCIEDALLKVLHPGYNWWTIQEKIEARSLYEAFKLHPVYKLLLELAQSDREGLWAWSDSHTVPDRVNLLKIAIHKLESEVHSTLES